MSLDNSIAFLAGDSETAQLMRQQDWAATTLGPPATWPQSLRPIVNVMLGSAFPMFVCWGPSLATLYNDAYAEIMGAKHPAGLGQPFLEIWSEIRADLVPLVERTLAGESFYMENLPLLMHRRGYEEETWFTFSYSPVLDDEGRVSGLYCACSETTRNVLAERQQRAQHEWLQTLFHQAPGFAAVLRGPDHVFDMANEAYMQIVGSRDLIGRSVEQALPGVAEQGFVALLDGVYDTGQPFVGRSMPVKIEREGGGGTHEAFVDFMYQPLRGAAGAVEGIFVQGHDVTEQHRAQQVLREADRQKDEFLATLAHELRNPLAPIRSAVHLLGAPAATEATRRRAAEVIGRQVGQMARLLDDLIDIARVTERRLVLRKESITVAAVVEVALEAARPLAQAKRHRLTTQVESPQTTLVADPVRLAQVLSNLLNNACKYTDPGGQIALEVHEVDGWTEFSVSDTGIGMARESLGKVFKMFAQEQSALERSEGGLGIGLALAKGLVELHGGEISAFSEGAGRGSRFVVRLPASPPALPPVADPATLPAAASGPRPRSVLLADDNTDAIEVLAEILRMDGHQVFTALDGHQAAELAAQVRPDVLVLDIGMPGLNGYQVAQAVRSQDWTRRPLLIAATGWGQEDDRKKALECGFDLHLTKPFDPQQLRALLTTSAD